MIKYYITHDENGEITGRFTTEFSRQLPVDKTELAVEQYEESLNHTHFVDGEFITVIPELTEQQLRDQFKRDRQKAVDELTVNVDGMVFDADEESQGRMSRAIVALEPLETQLWVLNDNTVVYPTREQLKTALRLAGQAQTSIWVAE